MITGDEALYWAKKYHDKHGGGGGKIYCDTSAHWETQVHLVSEEGAIYVYLDKTYDAPGADITAPSIKIGDGLAYVVDLPFQDELISDEVMQRIAEQTGGVTEAEREMWNNKVSAYLPYSDLENLVLSKTNYVVNGDIYYG